MFAILAMLLVAGCGGGTRPELGTVRGTVTLDQRPLPEAIVVFTPDGGGRQSMGVTDESGRYTLRYIRNVPGAKVGTHQVAITMAEGARYTGAIPKRYNAETKLVARVNPGENTHDFGLTSQ